MPTAGLDGRIIRTPSDMSIGDHCALVSGAVGRGAGALHPMQQGLPWLPVRQPWRAAYIPTNSLSRLLPSCRVCRIPRRGRGRRVGQLRGDGFERSQRGDRARARGRAEPHSDGEQCHRTFDGTKTCVTGSDTSSVTGRWDVTRGTAKNSMDMLIDRPFVAFRPDECGRQETTTGGPPANTIRGVGQCSMPVDVGRVDRAHMFVSFIATR